MARIYYEALITDGLGRAEKQKRTVDTVDKYRALDSLQRLDEDKTW